MSNRLESLNSQKPGAKPALKFKPKVVARKSKEDREKNAPVVKSEDKSYLLAGRGRGSLRGRGRGRGGSYVGTHVVSSGPLASGSVGMGGTASTKTGNTSDRIFNASGTSSPDPLANLKAKSRAQKSPTPNGEESDDEPDRTKINMSKEYQFEDSETVLFPVRPAKDTTSLDLFGASAPALVASSRAGTLDDVKSETPEIKAEEMLESTDLPTDPVERDEYNRLLSDQQTILDLLTTKMGGLKTDEESQEDKYMLFHIPQVVPKEQKELEARSQYASDIPTVEGQVGQLNFHRSGKITINIGENTKLNVLQGVPSSFLQELFVVDSHAAGTQEGDDSEMLDEDGDKILGNIFRLGEITGKIVATPAL